MKKLTVMTIVLAILLALTTAVCAAEVEAKVGDEVTVTFSFGKDAEGNAVKLAGYQGYITYNKDKLTYVEDSASSTYATVEEEGKLKVSYIGTEKSELTAQFELKKDLEAGEVVDAELKLDLAALEDETRVTVAPVVGTVTAVTPKPTDEPTQEPTTNPTTEPTQAPTTEPTQEPTKEPTTEPTSKPTAEPTQEPTQEPTTTPDGKDDPSSAPTMPSSSEPNTNDEDEAPSTPADGKEEPTTFDKTGVSVAFVGIIALIAIAGAVVLMKRK